jgi:3-methyladenine DNA glycosylase AlkD
MSPAEAGTLLRSPVHEERLTAVFILVRQFRSGEEEVQQQVVDLVLANTGRLNNWDLVDSCAPYVLGPWLARRDRAVLDRLAASELVWDRRTAVMSTFAFIRDGEFEPTLGLARQLLHDPHDLIHKAVGWMLREVGNRDRATEERFLHQYAADMPRVMLRYAIEKFPAERRRDYLGLERRGNPVERESRPRSDQVFDPDRKRGGDRPAGDRAGQPGGARPGAQPLTPPADRPST